MRSKEWRWLILILIVGGGLRLLGISFGLPHLFHADEPRAIHHALSYSTGDLNPHYFWLPPLLSYVLFVLFGLYFLVLGGLGGVGSVAEFGELFLRDPSSFYLIGRVAIGVSLGVASLYLVYRIASIHWSR